MTKQNWIIKVIEKVLNAKEWVQSKEYLGINHPNTDERNNVQQKRKYYQLINKYPKKTHNFLSKYYIFLTYIQRFQLEKRIIR